MVLTGCSELESPLYAPADFETEADGRMVHVVTSSAKVILGTDDKEAKANERPGMEVSFDYDFSMDVHETTCGEFNSLMPLQLACENDSLPAVRVTFYDAVLYANARSYAEKKDSVYSYEKAEFDSDGHCTNLEGYVFNPEENGYRLPTEAEWMLVASRDWNLKNAWTAENSGFEAHPVCSKSTTKAGVCDIAGNVMEWVNDWMGAFRDTSVANHVGAPDGGGAGERIIKGGSYRNLSTTTKIYNRGDVYVVTSSTQNEYVGFRLALGSIVNPTWMDKSGLVQDNNMHVLASATTVRSKLRSYKAKLFFRNDVSGNLAFIDYSNAHPSVEEIQDTMEVYHPDASPNGSWVAYCTKIEGSSKASTLYVRNVKDLSSPAIKLDVESAAIPRWIVKDNGDTAIVYVSSAGDNTDGSSFMAQSTWQVVFSNGKFGTPEKLFDGAYHGGVSDDSRLAVTGSKLLRARISPMQDSENVVDTVWYNGEQACNVSLFRDGSKRVAFLDFAGKTGHEFVGENYETHERILVVDSTGKLVQSVAAPKGFVFDHSEWVTGDLLVATLTNELGAHKKIVLVNLGDSSIVNLADGDELWHPCLWTFRNVSLSDNVLPYSDSAGLYYQEQSMQYMYVLRDKMETFWKTKDSVTLVAMGSSRTMHGINGKYMPDHVVLNMAYVGSDLFDANFLINNYIFNHVKNLKYFVLELAPDMFFRTFNYHWPPTYEMNPGYAYDEKHDFWVDGVPEGFIEAVESCPSIEDRSLFAYDEDYLLPSKSWGKAEISMDSLFFKDNVLPMEPNYAIFKQLVDRATAAGVKVVAVIYPRHPGYGKTGTYGAFGPMRSVAKEIIDSVAHMGIPILDENKWGKHDYTDKMAYDNDHLSYLGAEQLSRRVDSLLKTLK